MARALESVWTLLGNEMERQCCDFCKSMYDIRKKAARPLHGPTERSGASGGCRPQGRCVRASYLLRSPRARCQPALRREAKRWWPDTSDDCTQGCVALQPQVT
ncbi:hypothetical protein I79_015638 [Cricetulus griseus]|uniref:Uncharacterized protein n=1 Tax=Cricetulus griseus TaxID=10029 RepID=G3HXB9_CRIGR|nr:hypothetical protein I79_015638 [Cricetulus griseus]